MKSMLIKAFLIMVLIFQFGLDVQSQTTPTPFDPSTDDGTSGTGTGGTGGGGTGGGSTYTGGSTGRNDVPIDAGLSLLLAAGIGYGVTRARKNIKMKS